MLASGNAGKLREFSELLAATGLILARQSDFGIEPPPETGSTFLENALIKARNAARLTGLPAIADDSGIEVDALGGAPGVYSARYAGEDASDEANLSKLLPRSPDCPREQRTARYRCVIVCVNAADDPQPLVGEGAWEGRIIDTRRGSDGFGYDPSFVPAGDTRTVAEMPQDEKNLLSHRGQALRAFLAQLRSTGAPMKAPPLALYAHFPWCVQKCPYCDFNSYTLRDELPEQRYIDALLRDLDAQLPDGRGPRRSPAFSSVAARPACFRPPPSGGSSNMRARSSDSRTTSKSRSRPTPAPSSAAGSPSTAPPASRAFRSARRVSTRGSSSCWPHPFRRRDAARGRRAACRRPRELQSRSHVRACPGRPARKRRPTCARRWRSHPRTCRNIT